MVESAVRSAIVQGTSMLKYEDILVTNSCDWYGQQKIHIINGMYVIVAIINSRMLVSQLGNKLLKKFPLADFSAVISVKNGTTKYSLRSEDSRFDVSHIAQLISKGGGHRNAAGFDIKELKDSVPFPVPDNDIIILDLFNKAEIKDDKIIIKIDAPFGSLGLNKEFQYLLLRKFGIRTIRIEYTNASIIIENNNPSQKND